MRYPQVLTKVDLPALDKAHLIVAADLENPGDQAAAGHARGVRSKLSSSNKPSSWPATRHRRAWNSRPTSSLN